MAQVGKENQQDALPLPELAQKESVMHGGNVLRSSKIPVLSKSKSGVPLEQKQLHQQKSEHQQACTSSGRSKVPYTGSAPGDGGLQLAAALLPKSFSREPLGEVQLSTSGHRNEGSMSDGKGVSTVEFVPDVAALASILSNTGLNNHMVSSTHKPSLARRVPLRGNRACSASTGTARGSLYTNVPERNLARFSCISKSTSKADSEHPQSCRLTLNTQQLKTLSTSLKNSGPRVEAIKPRQTAQDLKVGKSEDPTAKPSTECMTIMTQENIPLQSSTGTNEATGSSWKDEEFVPDPAAKASILSNEGLSRFALGAHGKLSLAQRVPVKSAQKPPVPCSSTKGENGFLREPNMRVSSIGKFGRVSCYSTQGLKGLKKSVASGDQLTNTPGDRFSAVDCSPYMLARRVPISCPQSLHPRSRTFHRVPLSSCRKDRKLSTQQPTGTEEVKVTGSVTPQMVTEDSKQDNTAVPWGKIAVRLFDEEEAASAKKVPAAPVITPEMGKPQCIELLAQFLRQETNNGSVEHDAAPSLEELHKLLSAHCLPAHLDQLSTPSQNPRPNLCKPTPLSAVVAPETSTTLIMSSHDTTSNLCKPTPLSTVVGPETSRTLPTVSSQPPLCPSTSVHLPQPPSSRTNSTGQVKQRLDDLLRAPQRFHEACLNDECAFYTARIMSVSQPSVQRCKDPVAKILDSHDAMHFIPISAPLSPLEEGQRPASS